MEVAQSSVGLDYSKSTSSNLFCKQKTDIESNNITFAEIMDKDLLHMFEYNEASVQYYLGLKEAVIESRRKGELCWCDPRDVEMKGRLKVSGWKPMVVYKLPPEQQDSSEDGGVEYCSKQVALDEDGLDEVGEDIADLGTLQVAGDGDATGIKMESDIRSFTCGLGGCRQSFTSLAGYESHYHTSHNFVCHTCRNSFVSAFLLDIHLEENHDSYFQVLSPRIDMFRCLVESCKLKFKTPELRKDHLMKAHQLPASFMFHKPIKTTSKKIKATVKSQPVSSYPESNSMDVSHEPSSNTGCQDGGQSLPNFVARTKHSRREQKVPKAVCFGRGSQKAFSSQRPAGRRRHWHQVGAVDMDTAVDIEKVDFTDLVDSLECS
ncbi:hypothetical protein BsWGS_28616 [Bradybaena similaris]